MSEPTARAGEVYRAFAVFVEPPSPEHEAVAASLGLGEPPTLAEHTELFEFQLFPYASVYLGREGMQGGAARDRIAGFWRVLELEPPTEPDHLTVLLAAYGALLDRESEAEAEEDRANWRHVREVFLHEHLLSWLPVFLGKLERHPHPFYSRWARLLQALLSEEGVADRLAGELPAALRELEPLPDPRRHGGDAFLAALLAPGRSGFVVTRDDLTELAAAAGLGRRVAERRYVLQNLLGQDGHRVLEGLAQLARAEPLAAMPEVTRRWWQQRAGASRRLLLSLAADRS